MKLKTGVYKHFSGLMVLVLGIARHSETEEKLIVYIPLGVKTGPRITVRPYDNFFAFVEKEGIKKPRFTYIGEEIPENLAKDYLLNSKKQRVNLI